jgi:hypothetical protein
MTVTPEEEPREDPDKWLMDIIYFLSHGLPPEELLKAKRKRLGVRSWAFSLMNDNLYHQSADGDVWFDRMSGQKGCGNATVEWPEGITQGKLRPGRFGKADYGGLVVGADSRC